MAMSWSACVSQASAEDLSKSVGCAFRGSTRRWREVVEKTSLTLGVAKRCKTQRLPLIHEPALRPGFPEHRPTAVDFTALLPYNREVEVHPMVHSPTTEVMPFAVDVQGVLRVGNTRVTLDTVLTAFADGATAEEIVQQYPSLHLADVYSVIAYSLRHTTKIDTYLQQRRAQREAIRQQNEARFDPHGVRDRLLPRRAGDGQEVMLLPAADENFSGNIFW